MRVASRGGGWQPAGRLDRAERTEPIHGPTLAVQEQACSEAATCECRSLKSV